MTRREAVNQMMTRLNNNRRSGVLSQKSYDKIVEMLPTLDTEFIKWCFISDLLKITKDDS